jgi:large subunit ribosomal protein LP1
LWCFILLLSNQKQKQADITTDQVNALLQATGNTEVEAFYPIIFANYLGNPEKLGALIAFPSVGGSGGGAAVAADAGAPAAEAKPEEKEEELEMDLGGGMDMFAGDDGGGGGGGDY